MTNSKTQFTPGPWEFIKHGDAAYVRIYIGKAGLPVSATGHAEFSVQPFCRHSEAQANARLIAAAPELYDALRNLEKYVASVWVLPECPDEIVQARAALAKASACEPARSEVTP